MDTSAPRLERARRLSAAEGLRNVTYERGDGQPHRFPPAHFDPSISRFGTVIIEVRIHPHREQEARTMLTDVILPQAKALPGFVSGQWLRALDGHTLRSVHIYDTRENAEATASRIVSEGPRPARR